MAFISTFLHQEFLLTEVSCDSRRQLYYLYLHLFSINLKTQYSCLWALFWTLIFYSFWFKNYQNTKQLYFHRILWYIKNVFSYLTKNRINIQHLCLAILCTFELWADAQSILGSKNVNDWNKIENDDIIKTPAFLKY